MEDGLEARKLLNFPGGLELHIGVRWPSSFPCLGSAFLIHNRCLHSACRVLYFSQASSV